MAWRHLRGLFDGDLEIEPAVLTIIQSVTVTILAVVMAVALWLTIGIRSPTVWYQIFAALFIAATLAPIFLYPTYRTAHRLRAANLAIQEQALTDNLTKLPNSLALANNLDERMGSRDADPFAVHFIDVDRFKHINDSLGHDVGNTVLSELSANLKKAVGDAGFVARFGGDEFVVLQNSTLTETQAVDFAKRIGSAVSPGYRSNDDQVVANVTIGTALAPLHGKTRNQIMKAADLALYRAKKRGVKFALFQPEMALHASRNRVLEEGLLKALDSDELVLEYQPIVHRDNTLRVASVEALLRWILPNGETVSPAEFIPIAEQNGSIVRIGEWVLRQACIQCRRWPTNVSVSVNISPVQFLRSDMVTVISQILADTDLPAERLEIEITESVLIDETAYIRPIINELRAIGVRVALDDFGSGYCGLNYLRSFTIDKIKVDKTILDDALRSRDSLNILRAVWSIASENGMIVVVEGVDTDEKAELLAKERCCDQVQGFLYCAPVSAHIISTMLGRTETGRLSDCG